jgi:leucyl aminopeptidase
VVLATEPAGAGVVAVPLRPTGGDAAVEPSTDVPGGVDAAALLARDKAKGGAGEVCSAPGEEPVDKVLLVGVGEATPAELRKAGAAVARRAGADVAIDLRGLALDAAQLGALVEGLRLASYRFTEHKSEAPDRTLTTATLVVPDPAAAQPAVDAALHLTRATAVARDLVNTPSLVKSPQWLADTAVQLLDGLDVTVLDEQALAKGGFGGILGVGQGSSRPPRLVRARWDGGAGPHVVLVGKGITFDTGGLSLKPNASMLGMKADMGGAAAVLATVRAAADLRLPVRVTALAALAENMPSGTAQRPGDVLRQYGGRTVEVLNTDAEGRLVLADALAYADAELRPDVMVDVATLTGAMPIALGNRTAGLFASDDALAAQLEQAARDSGEPLWRMPLVDDYRHALESPVADLRNIGQPKLKLMGGSITAALFLREFTGGRPWAHLDIAGPATSSSDDDERTKGGTGYGVRLLTAWLTALAAQPNRRRRSA